MFYKVEKIIKYIITDSGITFDGVVYDDYESAHKVVQSLYGSIEGFEIKEIVQ